MPNVSIKIEGLAKAAEIPGFLERGQREFLERVVERTAEEIAKEAPGGAGGSVGRSWQGVTLSSTRGVVFSGHPGAKALARGAFITPRAGTAIRFASGEVRRFSRLPKTNYDKKGLRRRLQIAREEFAKAFGGP